MSQSQPNQKGCIRVKSRLLLQARRLTQVPLSGVSVTLTGGPRPITRKTNKNGEVCFKDLNVGATYKVICPLELDQDGDGIPEFQLAIDDDWIRCVDADGWELDVPVTVSGTCDDEPSTCSEVDAYYELVNGQAQVADALQDFQSIRAAVDDLANYAAPAVVMAGRTGAGGVVPAGGAGLESMVRTAFAEVLGVPPDDLAAVQRALPQRFERKEGPGGRPYYEWKPGALVVETLLGAVNLTGNQARLYQPAERTLEESRGILKKISPLIPDADEDLVDAQRSVVLDLMAHLVAEFGREQEPREVLVERLFFSLDGELDALEESLGYKDAEIIDLDDEEQRTLGLMLRDNVDKLRKAWDQFVQPDTNLTLGAQFRVLSRTLASVAESVQEARAMLASVRFGPAEQKTIKFDLANQKMTIDDLLSMVELFATVKAPRFIQEGKKVGVRALLPLTEQLYDLVDEASRLQEHPFGRLRVRRAFEELATGLLVVRETVNKLLS